MELLKLLSASEIAAQIISFLLLLFILRIFAWKPLLKLLDERKTRIAEGFKKIEDTQAELSALKAKYEEELGSIEQKAREKIQEAIQQGQKASEEIKQKAKQEANRIIESAKEDIKFEISRAKEELKDQIVDLTIKATEQIIQEKLTEKQDRKLIYDFLKGVDEIE